MRRIITLILLAASLVVPVAAGAQEPISRPTTPSHTGAKHTSSRTCVRRHRVGRKLICISWRKRSEKKTTRKHSTPKKTVTKTTGKTKPGTTAKPGTTQSGTTKTGTTGTGATKTTPGSSPTTTTGHGTAGSVPAGSYPDPSGTPIPTGSPSGWTEDFADDFTAASMAADPQWTSYSGAPAGEREEGWWDPTHSVITNGELQLEAYQDPSDDALGALPGTYVTGGVETATFSQTYGKYLVRMRIDQGQGVSLSALLWPISDGSHQEIDFVEDNGASPREWNTATVHYGPGNTKIVNALEIDLTQWHTYGVEWSPGEVVYTVDGRDWATVMNPNVPSLPMRLDLQTQSWRCGADPWEECPDGTTPSNVNLDVDWVVAYRQN